MTDPLIGPKLKVKRAYTHIQEINRLIDEFVARKPYAAFIDIDPATGEQRLRVRPTEQLPATIGIVCGEVLYLLRSAFDHLVTSVATKRGIVTIKNTGFPVEETRKKFVAEVKQRKIEQRLPQLASILRRLEPYKGGAGDLLWWLHWLNGMEKHKVVVAVAAVGNRTKADQLRIVPTKDFGSTTKNVRLRFPRKPLLLHEEPIVLVFPANTTLHGNMDLFVEVTLSDIETIDIAPVVSTLQQMSKMTSAVINLFEKRFFLN